jgi:hypothetical protein
MSEQLSQIDRDIQNLENQEISDYLDNNSTSIEGLLAATQSLQTEIKTSMALYAHQKLGVEDSKVSDIIDDAIGEESPLEKEFQAIAQELSEEVEDISFIGKIGKNIWFKLSDVFSDKRVDGLADRLDPLENQALLLVERAVDKEFYTQKLIEYTKTYLQTGKNGGIDNIDYNELMTIFDQIDSKNTKYPELGEILSEDEIKQSLDILGEDHNPLLVLYRHRDMPVEDQILSLVGNEALRSRISVDDYFLELNRLSHSDSDFSASTLATRNELSGNEDSLNVSSDHVAHFLRFLYRYPTLNTAFQTLSTRRNYSGLYAESLQYTKREDYALDDTSDNSQA